MLQISQYIPIGCILQHIFPTVEITYVHLVENSLPVIVVFAFKETYILIKTEIMHEV